MPCVSNICGQGRIACPTPWNCGLTRRVDLKDASMGELIAMDGGNFVDTSEGAKDDPLKEMSGLAEAVLIALICCIGLAVLVLPVVL